LPEHGAVARSRLAGISTHLARSSAATRTTLVGMPFSSVLVLVAALELFA